MTPERIAELKNISNRRGMYTEGKICDCLDECLDEIERLQRRTVSTAMVELSDARKEIERLEAENVRLQKELDGHAFEISRPMLLAKIEQLQDEIKTLRLENVRLTRQLDLCALERPTQT